MNALPRKAQIFLLSVHLLAVGAVVCAITFPLLRPPSPTWELLVYAVLALLAGGRKVRVNLSDRQEERGSLSLGFAIIFVAMLRGGPLVGSGVALLSCLSSCLYPKRQPPTQLLFNLSLTAVQSWVSGLVFYYANGRSLAISPAHSLAASATTGLVYLAINSAGVMGIIALCKGENPFHLWKDTVLSATPMHLAITSLVTLTVVASGGHVFAVLLFGGPIVFLLHQSYRTNTLLEEERQQRLSALQGSESRLAELYQESETRARQQKTLTHLGILALSGMDADAWMGQAVTSIASTLGVEYSVLLERSDDGQEFLFRAAYGLPAELIGRRQPAGTGSLAGYSFLNRRGVVVEDIGCEDRFSGGLVFEEHGAKSGVCTLVCLGSGEPWGVLGAYSKTTRPYPEGCREFLHSVSSLIALGLDRHRQVEMLERKASEIAELNVRLQRAMAETHHRVKNNLQIVNGLIELQRMEGDTISEADVIRLSTHIRALATIHDLLTQQAKENGSSEYLSARDALDRLIPLVRDTAGVRRLDYHADDALLPISKGTSLAVLLNELVSNAVKHGSGDILVSLAVAGGRGRLEVSDDGPGFPEGFNSSHAANTGLELVESLSRWDLQGEPSYENRPSGGARVVVDFPVAVVDGTRLQNTGGESREEVSM
jgi:two-component sensor histidine kinase